MSMRTIQQAFAVAACATAILGAGATSASAGEITGNYEPGAVVGEPVKGRDLPVNGRSFCAFSGQNDGYHDPSQIEGPGDELHRVQSYGQVVKAGGKALAPAPGVACNPTRGFAE